MWMRVPAEENIIQISVTSARAVAIAIFCSGYKAYKGSDSRTVPSLAKIECRRPPEMSPSHFPHFHPHLNVQGSRLSLKPGTLFLFSASSTFCGLGFYQIHFWILFLFHSFPAVLLYFYYLEGYHRWSSKRSHL
jgi:hypothetical protein